MIKNKIIMESKKIREDKAWNYLEKNRDQLFDTIFSHNEVTGIIERNDTIDISINEFGFHKKYLKEINNILEITRFYKLTEDNNIVKKYIKLKSDIEKSHDAKKYLIDLSLKNSKYKFLPHLYSEKLKFLIPIARLDKFYRIIAEQAKYQTTKIIKNKEILKRKKISNWKKLELKSILKEIKTNNLNCFSEKINIKDPKLYEKILYTINCIIFSCINYKMKKTNYIRAKYEKLRDDITKASNPNKLIIKLSIVSATYKLDSRFFIHRPNILYSIFTLEYYFKKIAIQTRVKQINIINKNIKF